MDMKGPFLVNLRRMESLNGVATGGWGQLPPPHFCQNGAGDFFKIDEKIGVGRVVANRQRSRGRGQRIFIYALHFCSPGHAPAQP